ncbi:hypothetical protein K501DRAFT_229074, partial [Backusella circina FSU 941]
MRPIIYPEAEELIRNKKQQKIDEQEGLEESSTSTVGGRRRRRKTKDSPEELRAKKAARMSRSGGASESSSIPLKRCSCGSTGHSSKRSKDCPNHDFTLKELMDRDLEKYTQYTVSITFDSFIANNNHIGPARDKIILL